MSGMRDVDAPRQLSLAQRRVLLAHPKIVSMHQEKQQVCTRPVPVAARAHAT